MATLIMVAQLLLGLSLLVFVHELGHFLAAKAFGMRVNKFYIFFDAAGKKLWSKTVGETEYGVGWLPIGGYVQIAGMIDETQDAQDLSAEPEEWEFRSKPAWQRFIVMIGGIVMNIITGILIFTYFLHHYEKSYLPVSELNKDGIYAYQAAQDIGIQTGDKILAVNGKTPDRFKDVVSTNLYLGGELKVQRGSNIKDIQIPDDFYKKMGEPFIAPFYEEIIIADFVADSPAAAAGLKKGDKIIKVDQQETRHFTDLAATLNNNKTTATITVERNGEAVDVVTNKMEGNKLGVNISTKSPYTYKDYNFGSALKYSFVEGYDLIASQIVSFGMLFTGKLKATESLASPIGIARIYGGVWDWARFWKITGFLSFILAFMNILPIPALDGGHMVFLTVEMITGRKLSDNFLEKAQIVGFVLILFLMIFAFGNDIYKLLR